ncbi:MAG: NAD(P)-dependent oxidoreductase [Ruthenibacterium sp.]
MRVAILGSTGYLGSRLARRLRDNTAAADDREIVCVYRKTSNLASLADLRGQITPVLNDYDSLKRCFGTGQTFDCVINTACSYLRGATNEQVMESNLLFPLHVLDMVAERGRIQGKRTRFISIGTGLPDAFNLYTYTKKQLNDMGRYLAGLGHVQFINIELENYYGPHEPAERFLPQCIRSLAAGEPVLLTSGEQHRDFVHIEDVLDALMRCIAHERLPNYFDVPIGSGEAPSIHELITYLAALLHSPSELRFGAVTARQNEPSCCADLSAYLMMGGAVRWPWRQGLKQLLIEEGYAL